MIHQSTSYELRVIIVTSFVYCMSYELQVAFIARVTSFLLYKNYELLFMERVKSYFLPMGYELHSNARVTSYFLDTSYEF